MFSDVTETAIEQANTLLAFLTDRSTPDWKSVFTQVLGEQELELNVRNVTLALEKAQKDAPVGALLGGTGLAKAEAGLEGEDSQRAVRLLKQTGRLIQAGKGRGKALCILSSEPLKAEDFAAAIAKAGVAEPAPTPVKPIVAERPDNYVAIDDVPELLRAVANNFKTLSEQLDETQKDLRVTGKKLEESDQVIKELQAENQKLEEKLERRERLAEVTNWS